MAIVVLIAWGCSGREASGLRVPRHAVMSVLCSGLVQGLGFRVWF